jgi:NAD+ synthase (glutamine-hydrolysing)
MNPLVAAPFRSLYRHGFVRVASAVPRVRIAEPLANAEETLRLASAAGEEQAALVVFPELGLSGYSIEDLFHQQALVEGVLDALERVVAASAELLPVLVVGAPVLCEGALFNTAVVIHRGRVLGVAPKSYLPEYHEFYEKRHFRAARDLIGDELRLLGETVPFSPRVVFEAADVPGLAMHVEVCEDLWAPIPPSTYGALAGASVLANLSDSNITIGKADYRRLLCASQSARCIAGYVFSSAGAGESTTDLAWDGQALIYENGDRLAESERFATEGQLIYADLNLDRLLSDRSTTSTFTDTIHDHDRRLARVRRVEFTLGVGAPSVSLRREIERFPYVPADPVRRNERCEEV